MRAAVALLAVVTLAPAIGGAAPVPVVTNGIWTTLSDTESPVKSCAVQALVNGGRFTLSGATDRPNVLRLSLYKSAWRIPGVAVPIVLTFSGGETLNLTGAGQDSTIRADVPDAMVRPLVHYFTADAGLTVTLPEGHERPWVLDLRGTSPATLAMTHCIDAAQVFLPPPFQPPVAASPTVPVASTLPPETDAPPAAPIVNQEPVYTATQTADAQPESAQNDNTYTPPPAASAPTAGAAVATLGVSGFLIALCIGGIALYFIPYLIGSSRKIESKGLLFMVNLFFGWTVIGWFGCLLWAALAQDGVQRALYRKLLKDERA